MQTWITNYGAVIKKSAIDKFDETYVNHVVLMERENAKRAQQDNNATFERWIEYIDDRYIPRFSCCAWIYFGVTRRWDRKI